MKTIREIQDDIQAGKASAESLTKESLAQIEKTQEDNAYISVLQEQALERAAQLDADRAAGKNNGVLDGIPVAVKDNICVEDARATCGSKILENFVAPYNATVTEKLLNAGAVIVGKTNMDEFAMGSTSETSYFGPTKNPQAPDRIPGGSSGGSAAAVANGSVSLALGSDTGGSIRQPAACCGVVGLKPTYGRVSRYGLVAYASSLDQIGPLTNNVADSALLLNVIAGQDDRDNSSAQVATEDFTALLEQDIKGKIIGVPKEYFGKGLDDVVRQELEKGLDRLRAEGAEIKEVSLPSMSYAISSYYVVATAEASSNLSRFDGVRYSHRSADAQNLQEMFTKSRSEGFGEEVKRRILLGTYALSSGYYDAYYVQAQKVRTLIKDDFQKAFQECDVIAGPTMPGLPLEVGKGLEDPMSMYLSDIYTVSLNLAGLPGVSLPCGRVDGLKVGMQLMGKAFAESEILQVASALERTTEL
jgi:aspartyl-tRNA(Asn)/glutamyl-tRNA(Gln) amidotransferase subunit A